ncbi:Asp23/Gls24 family envelope stress response protein [Staphylococcus lutrae]|uniref:Alkaline shock protein 23 n=1 Tax=Staphylococcus lutrae TaxID=155085 RepID=A0AAC9WJZ9_9STAP|nr:Asp23/Gls24 family envelope stress response protein [Staphylococcus lutrae]ARJ51930.1 hypothetical protein B5P37_11675 [Staphylococcus lutrae]PNZ37805.1 Asp23/Gls24 family envelope stress response protein [Staphylococcus lutrae]
MAKSIEHFNPNLGNVEIVPEVISVIASIAVSEVKGVEGVFPDFKNSTLDRLGRKNLTKGIKILTEDNEIIIHVYCALNHTVKVSETALKVQKSIHSALNTMLALTPKQINIHITHIEMAKK